MPALGLRSPQARCRALPLSVAHSAPPVAEATPWFAAWCGVPLTDAPNGTPLAVLPDRLRWDSLPRQPPAERPQSTRHPNPMKRSETLPVLECRFQPLHQSVRTCCRPAMAPTSPKVWPSE